MIKMAIIAVLIIIAVVGVLSLYKQCPNNKILVKWGLGGKKVLTGGAIVVPFLQSHAYLKLNPMNIDILLGKNGGRDGRGSSSVVTQDKIRVGIEADATFTISQDESERIIASERLLGLSTEEIQSLALEILTGQTRAIISKMTFLDLLQDRDKLQAEVEINAEKELSKLGLDLTNFNIKDIQDYDGIALALGEKASAAATSGAAIATAEEVKKQEIGKATQESEQSIKVAEANRDKDIKTAEISAETKTAANESKLVGIESDQRKEQKEAQLVAETEKVAETAKIEKDKTVRLNGEIAKQEVADQQTKTAKKEGEATLAFLQATEVVNTKIANEKEVLDAKKNAELKVIEANAKKDVAETEAEAIKVAAQAEAFRITELATAEAAKIAKPLLAKAEAEGKLLEIYAKPGADKLIRLKELEIIPEAIAAQAKAVSNIKFDSVNLIGGAGGSGDGAGSNQISGFVKDVMGALPMINMANKMAASLDLPELDIKKAEKVIEEGTEVVETTTPKTPKETGKITKEVKVKKK